MSGGEDPNGVISCRAHRENLELPVAVSPLEAHFDGGQGHFVRHCRLRRLSEALQLGHRTCGIDRRSRGNAGCRRIERGGARLRALRYFGRVDVRLLR
jgi:hypothetical protein